MKAMREIEPQRIKDECSECQGLGVKHFNTIDDLVDYIEKKQEYFDQHLASIRQYFAEGGIDCPICNGKGYTTRRQ